MRPEGHRRGTLDRRTTAFLGHIVRARGRVWLAPLVVVVLAAWTSFVPASANKGSALNSESAGEAARVLAEQPKIERELPERRTAKSRTYLAENGESVARIFAAPVNFKDSDGDWKAIDNSLVESPAAGYALRNKANGYTADLPADLGSPTRFASPDGSLRITLRGTKAKVAADGSTARYREAFRGVDVSLQARADGLKELITLADSDARTSFSYLVEASEGITAKETDAGGIAFRDASGEVVFAFKAPFMYDASRSDAGVSDQVDLNLAKDGDDFAVTMSADRDWLADRARRWPVVIDPYVTYGDMSVKISQPLIDTYTSGETVDTGHGGLSYLKAGLGSESGTPHEHSTLLKFEAEQVIPRYATVLGGTLGVYASGQSATTPAPLNVHEALKPWTEAATWNKYDGVNSWTTPGGDVGDETGCVTPQVGQWTYFNDTAKLVQHWVDRTRPNHGFVMRSCSDSPPNNYYEFVSKEGDSTKWPYLKVWYHEPMGAKSTDVFLTPNFDASEHLRTGEEAQDLQDVNVNLATGNLLLRAKDGPATAQPDDLHLDRFYNSWMWSLKGSFGRAWSEGEGRSIRLRSMLDGSKAVYVVGYAALRFTQNADGTYSPPPGFNGSLTHDPLAGTYRFTQFSNGTSFVFSASDAAMTYALDPAGNKADVTYDPNSWDDNLTSRTDAETGLSTAYTTVLNTGNITGIDEPGRALRYTYHPTLEKLTTTSLNGTTRWRYEYDTSKRLTAMVDPDGKRTTFTYGTAWGGRQIASVTRITDPTTGAGKTWRFSQNYTAGTSQVTRPDGQVTTYTFNADGSLRDLTAPAFAQDFNVRATRDPATGNANVDWDVAVDAPLADGSEGSGTTAYIYRVQRNAEAWTASAETTDPMTNVAGSALGDQFRVEVRARDAAGNVSNPVTGTVTMTTEGDPCRPTGDGLRGDCVDDDIQDAVEGADADLEPGATSPGARAATDTFYIRVKGSDWTTVRRNFKSFVIGNARTGWQYQRIDRSYTGTLGYTLGFVGGEFDSCGWVKATNVMDSTQRGTTNCPSDFKLPNKSLMVAANCRGCDDGTLIQTDRSTPICPNLTPIPGPRDRTAGNAPPFNEPKECDGPSVRTLPAGSIVRWRYVTLGPYRRNFVMARFNNPVGNDPMWAFIRRTAFDARSLCDGGTREGCGTVPPR